MLIAWYPFRWWDWYIGEEEKKGIKPFFTEKNCINFGNGKIWQNWCKVVGKVDRSGKNAFSACQQDMILRCRSILGHM